MNISNITKILLNISIEISDMFEELAKLSYYNQENTEDFINCVESIRNLENRELIILNTIKNKEKLIAIFKELEKLPQINDEGYVRCYDLIDSALEKLIETEKTGQIEYEEETSSLYEETNETSKLFDDIEDIKEKYYMEEDIGYVEINDTLNICYINAIKKMLSTIQKTEATNKIDSKYKKQLIKYFNAFKYYFFTINIDLERLGAKCYFNIDNIKVKNINQNKEYLQILYYNECITLIDKFYHLNKNDKSVMQISETLFDMICFEEYLNELQSEYIEKLFEFINELSTEEKTSFYGNIVTNKLIKRKAKN